MNKPKMILFDYGHTLLCEPGFNTLRGEEALFKYVKYNKNNLTPKQVNDFSQELFEKIGIVRSMGMELHEWQFQRMLYEYLEIELSISMPEAEKVFWDNTSSGAVMPNADRMIDYINANGIRSGVISNLGFSGAALIDRINRLLPQSKFEFIIASSEYMFRKPNPMLFELALKKTGLDAKDVWFCGDNIKADIEGSSAVGMFPVWYEDELMDNPWCGQDSGIVPNCAHLHIHDWMELISVLEGMQ
ncbi:MAG: HAD family hydrolase [Eubacteriales bacterium]|nr:HAD family hydrolase [Eubacteriales bacterium]